MSSGQPRLVSLQFPYTTTSTEGGNVPGNALSVIINATPPFTPTSTTQVKGTMNGQIMSLTVIDNNIFNPGIKPDMLIQPGFGSIVFSGINGATGDDVMVYYLDNIVYLRNSANEYRFQARIIAREKLASLSSF